MRQLVILLVLIFSFQFTFAITKQKKSTHRVNSNALGAKPTTEHNFSELAVQGRYQSAFEARAIVENEKSIDDLLDYRKSYSDRLKRMNEQN